MQSSRHGGVVVTIVSRGFAGRKDEAKLPPGKKLVVVSSAKTVAS